MNENEKLEFYKRRNEEKNEAIDKIKEICLAIGGHQDIFDIANDALNYIVVLEQKLEQYHPHGKGYKNDEDVRDLGSKYWGHVR